MSNDKIIEIIVKVKKSDGTYKTVKLKPDVEAIFFSDRAVNKMLAPFYKNDPSPHPFKRSDSEKAFGKKVTDSVFGKKNEINLTEKTIKFIWKELKKSPDIPMLSKIPFCTIE